MFKRPPPPPPPAPLDRTALRREAERCLLDLNVPHFHHELVKHCLVAAMESEAQAGKALGLLQQLGASGEVSATQMAKGFGRVEARLDDIALDAARAPQLFPQFKQQALEAGWLAA